MKTHKAPLLPLSDSGYRARRHEDCCRILVSICPVIKVPTAVTNLKSSGWDKSISLACYPWCPTGNKGPSLVSCNRHSAHSPCTPYMQVNILYVVIMDTLAGTFSGAPETCVLGVKHVSSILQPRVCFGKVASPTQYAGLMYIQNKPYSF